MNECNTALSITTIACQLFKCMDADELSILSADLIQLADTLAAMLVRKETCSGKKEPADAQVVE